MTGSWWSPNMALEVSRRAYGVHVVRWWGGGPGSHTLTRTVIFADGREDAAPVAGAVQVPGPQPDIWVDGDVPFGESVASISYRFGAQVVDVPPEGRRYPVLSDPYTGRSVNVVGAELGSRRWHSVTTATWLEVVAAGDPAVDARPEQAPIQNLGLYTTTRAAYEMVADLCVRRTPLLLRSPEPGLDDMWFVLVGERDEERLASAHVDLAWRKHSWDMHTTSRPDPRERRHVLGTMGGLATLGATLGDLANLTATLGGLALLAPVTEEPVRL